MSAQHIAIIKAAQPYAEGNQALYDLNKYWNISKHRNCVTLLPAVLHNVQAHLKGPGRLPAPRWDDHKNEMLLADCGPVGDYQSKIDRIEFNLLFVDYNSSSTHEPIPAVPLLKKMESEVRKLLVGVEKIQNSHQAALAV